MASIPQIIRNETPASTLVEGVTDLVPLPQAYVRIRDLVDDPVAELADVADIVSQDPALTARVLRLVNSAFVGLVDPIDSIEHAVRVLGMEQIHDMALATSAVGSLSKLRGDLIDIFEFWRLSVYAGGCAQEIAIRVNLPKPKRFFLCGLLHNVGNLIIAHEMPQAFADCRDKSIELGRPWFEMQREYLGFDYADVSAEMLQRWNLPAALSQPIADHTRFVANLNSSIRAQTSVVSIAATTARAAVFNSPASEPVPDYDPNALEVTNIDSDSIEVLMSHVDDTLNESLSVLLPDYG